MQMHRDRRATPPWAKIGPPQGGCPATTPPLSPNRLSDRRHPILPVGALSNREAPQCRLLPPLLPAPSCPCWTKSLDTAPNPTAWMGFAGFLDGAGRRNLSR